MIPYDISPVAKLDLNISGLGIKDSIVILGPKGLVGQIGFHPFGSSILET